jgi:hypothetical protein
MRLNIEMIEAKAFITFIRIYYLLKSDRLSNNIILTLHKELICYHDLCLPQMVDCSRKPSTKIAAPPKQSSLHHWKFSKAQTDSRFEYDFQTAVYIYN